MSSYEPGPDERKRGRSYSPSPPPRHRSRSRSPPRQRGNRDPYDYGLPPPRSSGGGRYDDRYDDRYRGPPRDLYRDHPPPPRYGGGYDDYPPRGGGPYRDGPHRDGPYRGDGPYRDYPPPPPGGYGRGHEDRPGPPPGRRDGSRRRDEGPPGVSLLIRNVSPDIQTEDLQRAFGRIGEIRDVYIPRDYHSHQPKGFAFIEFATPEMAAEARNEMDKFVIKGQPLEVVFAQERRKTPNEMRGRVVNQQNRHFEDGGDGDGGPRQERSERSSSFERHQQREQEKQEDKDEPAEKE